MARENLALENLAQQATSHIMVSASCLSEVIGVVTGFFWAALSDRFVKTSFKLLNVIEYLHWSE